MSKASKAMFCIALIALLIPFPVFGQETKEQDESLSRTIAYLMDVVSKSNLTFIRNGSKHSAAEGVQVMKAKYEHYKPEIKTPEDFIRLCATKSLLSGEPYLVLTDQGEVPVSKWLTQVLDEYRKTNMKP